MKYLLFAALAIVVCTSTAAAQNRVELYADNQMATCSISEPVSPPIVQVHVFLVGPVSSTGARFRVPKPDCWVGATWLGDALAPNMGAAAGTSQSDWSIGFGHCAAGPAVYMAAISYLITNQALPCCIVDALPAGQFAFTDCGDFNEFDLLESKPLVVNPNESCGCQGGIVLKTETSTWGRVKALYQD